jgi:hypothetical protein
VYDFVFWTAVEDGAGKFALDIDVLADDEWIADWEDIWADEEAPQPLPKMRDVVTAIAATESMEREDGEFMPSPTNPIP